MAKTAPVSWALPINPDAALPANPSVSGRMPPLGYPPGRYRAELGGHYLERDNLGLGAVCLPRRHRWPGHADLFIVGNNPAILTGEQTRV